MEEQHINTIAEGIFAHLVYRGVRFSGDFKDLLVIFPEGTLQEKLSEERKRYTLPDNTKVIVAQKALSLED